MRLRRVIVLWLGFTLVALGAYRLGKPYVEIYWQQLLAHWIPPRHVPGSPQIRIGPPPAELTYTCLVQMWIDGRLASQRRVFYDRGKFRIESIDPRNGKILTVSLYNRDGQGLSFLYWDLPARQAGINSGALWRAAHQNPDAYYRRTRIPLGAATEINEPQGNVLLPFTLNSSYRKVGTQTVDGKRCTVYHSSGPGSPIQAKIWRGFILEEMLAPHLRRRVSHLQFVTRLDSSLFELLPGTVVKVPRDLRVRVPRGVQRIEYAGNGL